MYKGFELLLRTRNTCISGHYIQVPEFIYNSTEFPSYLTQAKRYLSSSSQSIRNALTNYIRQDGVLDGGSVSDDWFPNVDAHVFLSHSHADEDLVIAFAYWLERNFGIKSFIDSCVWGYADDLLKKLDNKYCYQPSSNTYNYSNRNRTTAFVHNLLATALAKMMDKCECLFFINTPNSLHTNNIVQETSSPWIYYELALSQVMRSKLQRRQMFSQGGQMMALNESFRVALPAQTSHLAKLNFQALEEWREMCSREHITTPTKALDILYSYRT